MLTFAEMEEELDLEYLFSRESISYKTTRGRSGIQLNVRVCPACGDSRYRVYMNADTGKGNCFVCNQGFSKLSFMKHLFELEWREIAKIAEEILRAQGWRPKKRVTAAVEMESGPITLPISEALPLPLGNLGYLDKRGINCDTARYFHLRWCEFGWWRFKNFEEQWEMQSFENRVIVPVFDLDGSLKTFQGRDITGDSPTKYLFPKSLPGTGRYLLNGHNVLLTKEVAMGEGFFDVAAMKIAFDASPQTRHIVPVGSFGKHLSYGDVAGDDQLGRFIQLKHKGLEVVTIMWDGEVKALTAALDAAKILSRIGLKVRIALLPPGRDPNEVTDDVVRQAYFAAETYSASLDARWRLRNPYDPRYAPKVLSHS